MFVFVCHKDKKQAIHHVLKRTCFLAHFQKQFVVFNPPDFVLAFVFMVIQRNLKLIFVNAEIVIDDPRTNAAGNECSRNTALIAFAYDISL